MIITITDHLKNINIFLETALSDVNPSNKYYSRLLGFLGYIHGDMNKDKLSKCITCAANNFRSSPDNELSVVCERIKYFWDDEAKEKVKYLSGLYSSLLIAFNNNNIDALHHVLDAITYYVIIKKISEEYSSIIYDIIPTYIAVLTINDQTDILMTKIFSSVMSKHLNKSEEFKDLIVEMFAKMIAVKLENP